MMAPEYYRRARAEAPYHVQVAIERVRTPWFSPGDCTVEGKVVQIFKDATGKLAKGVSISFPVACYREGDRMPIGGTVWTDAADLKQAKYIEAYLVDTEAGLAPAMWNSKIIAAPSAAPQFPVD